MALPEMTKYRREFVDGFAQTESLLMDRCVDEGIESGAAVVFDVADLTGELPERGVDGKLPRLSASDTQVTAALREYGGSFKITNFEAFKSQSNERDKQARKLYSRVNRRLDKVYIAELNNAATTYAGGAITVNVATIQKIIQTLATAQIPITPQDVTWVVTPQFMGQLMGINQFTSSDWVSTKPFMHNEANYTNQRKIKSWADIGWIASPLLPGIGTATATTFLYHRNALGCAKPSSQMIYTVGFNEEDQYYFNSGTVKAACKILQNGGILKVTFNDT